MAPGGEKVSETVYVDTPISKGAELRAQMDVETTKGLLLLNGGGAIALLAFIPQSPDAAVHPLVTGSVWGLFLMMVGLGFAVTHSIFRRKCSLDHEGMWTREDVEVFAATLGYDVQKTAQDYDKRVSMMKTATIGDGTTIVTIKRGKIPSCELCRFFMWSSLSSFLVGGFVVFISALNTF